VDDCNHDILVNSLCIASSLVMLVAGCVTGDLGVQSLNRRRRYNHMRQWIWWDDPNKESTITLYPI
jgi:hypothetical protein